MKKVRKELELPQQIELEIAKIAFLSNQINRKTKMCCFFNDTAHCELIEVRLHQTKKNYASTPVLFKMSYENSPKYDWIQDSESRLNELKRCVEFLEITLKDQKINYSLIEAVKEYVITSYEI